MLSVKFYFGIQKDINFYLMKYSNEIVDVLLIQSSLYI